MDEMGNNTDQSKDGRICGQRKLGAKGTKRHLSISTADCRWTQIPVLASSADLICMATIFQGDHIDGPTLATALGWDVSVPIIPHEDPLELLDLNMGPGKAFPGFPDTEFEVEGVRYTVPAFVTASPSGGITPKILVDLMRHLDKYAFNDLRRRFPGVKPVLLLDGHGSRFDPAYLAYITDPAHLWGSTLGIPNWTEGWQLGDAEQCNGSIHTEVTREKRAIMAAKKLYCFPRVLKPTDVPPIVSKAQTHLLHWPRQEASHRECAERPRIVPSDVQLAGPPRDCGVPTARAIGG